MASSGGALRLAAVDPAAAAEGLEPGLTLADARARLPGLRSAPAEPEADAAALAALADRLQLYSPLVGLDGEDGLLLDSTGCDHLFGGETALLERLCRRLGAGGLAVRAALADGAAAAWAWARWRPDGAAPVLAPGETAPLTTLPVEALRLPAASLSLLRRLGLRRVDELLALPPRTLTARFGPQLCNRLDQLLGRTQAPIVPRRPPPERRVVLSLAEPLSEVEALRTALSHLLERLCGELDAAGEGARALRLVLHFLDEGQQSLSAGTVRPSRSPAHLLQLFGPPLEAAETDRGVEALVLEVEASERDPPRQIGFDPGERAGGGPDERTLAELLDRLQVRLGPGSVRQIAPFDDHRPERAVRPLAAPVLAPADWPDGLPRPLTLLPEPEAIEAVAPVPDDPPLLFRWRGRLRRVRQALGPERISAGWWQAFESGRPFRLRDYYRVEAEDGGRYWLFREGAVGDEPPPRWFLHGLFG